MPNINPDSKVLFLYNPNSGRRIIQKNIDNIIAALETKFKVVTIVRSKNKDHLAKIIKTAVKKYDYVFFSGGDGTFNMVINSIPDDAKNLPVFGYLPGGTKCDMGLYTNISKNPKKGIYDLLKSNVIEYPVGQIGTHKFIHTCDSGNIMQIPHMVPPKEKEELGQIAYFKYTVKYLKLLKKKTTLIINGKEYLTPMFIFTNAEKVAGFNLNPEKDDRTPVYYVAIIKSGAFHGLFNIIYTMLHGVEDARASGRITLLYGDKFNVSADTDVWDVDGEQIKVSFPTTVGYSGRNIKLLVNRK